MIFHQTENSISNYAYNACFYQNVEWAYHFHKNFELLYVVSGKVRCTVNNKTDILGTGDWGMCLANEVHALHSEGDSQMWVWVFSGDFVHAFEKQVQNKSGEHFKFRCSAEIETYLKTILFYKERPDTYLLKSCLYAVCAEYCRSIRLTEQMDKSRLLMKDIVQYVSGNFQQKIELSDMAEALGYDYYYVSKCFRKIFNMSFTDYLNAYRLEYAMQMLVETEKSITAIAYESGFQSIRNFNHLFQKHIGKSPGQYRGGGAERKDV